MIEIAFLVFALIVSVVSLGIGIWVAFVPYGSLLAGTLFVLCGGLLGFGSILTMRQYAGGRPAPQPASVPVSPPNRSRARQAENMGSTSTSRPAVA